MRAETGQRVGGCAGGELQRAGSGGAERVAAVDRTDEVGTWRHDEPVVIAGGELDHAWRAADAAGDRAGAGQSAGEREARIEIPARAGIDLKLPEVEELYAEAGQGAGAGAGRELQRAAVRVAAIDGAGEHGPGIDDQAVARAGEEYAVLDRAGIDDGGCVVADDDTIGAAEDGAAAGIGKVAAIVEFDAVIAVSGD